MLKGTKYGLVIGLVLGMIFGYSLGHWGLEMVVKWLSLGFLIVLFGFGILLGFGDQKHWNTGMALVVIPGLLILGWWIHYYGVPSSSALPLMSLGMVPIPPKKKFGGISSWLRKGVNMTLCLAASPLVVFMLAMVGMKILAMVFLTGTGILSLVVGWNPTTIDDEKASVRSGMNILLGGLMAFIGLFCLWIFGGGS